MKTVVIQFFQTPNFFQAFQRVLADQLAALNLQFEGQVTGLGLFHAGSTQLARPAYLVAGFATAEAKAEFLAAFEQGNVRFIFERAMVNRDIIAGLPEGAKRMGFLGAGFSPDELAA